MVLSTSTPGLKNRTPSQWSDGGKRVRGVATSYGVAGAKCHGGAGRHAGRVARSRPDPWSPETFMTAASRLAALLTFATSALAASPDDPLARHLWKERVVVALAPSAADPRLATQRRLFAAMRAGAGERDLVLVEAADASPRSAALRRRFDVPAAAFKAVLIGKDGGEKLASDTPLGPDRLFPVIDAMPMRQQETRSRPQ